MSSPSHPAAINRRNALKTGLAGAGLLASGLTGTASAAKAPKPLSLKKGAVIVFQGDSITDANRDRKNKKANDAKAFGRGYPFHIASNLLMRHPDLDLTFYNRGVSGNRVPHLDSRWQADCIDLKPDVLSILVGVNDIWHKLNGQYDGTVETYETGFTALIERTRKALPKTHIVICEPFVLKCGAVKDNWFPEMTERIAAAKRVAEATGCTWVPFQEAFTAEVEKGTKPDYWAADGVHPSMAGHMLMAKVWGETTGLL
ncbi:SGNH/GDSL hydrolase family protein [Roseibacillus persicicus]|uniref:SGNH/GDSL hydrolase family protein n=1 Tax=Roseibacillus persicicus TaxID=454148 RepID=UPI00280F7004|nr:SGNH/GDSL hydrolase family protein [Roseibacillus persicicus]MDQ8189873.1 SGNH/GDSL hydrolase family protein [Roseibacillus persicicus]